MNKKFCIEHHRKKPLSEQVEFFVSIFLSATQRGAFQLLLLPTVDEKNCVSKQSWKHESNTELCSKLQASSEILKILILHGETFHKLFQGKPSFIYYRTIIPSFTLPMNQTLKHLLQ